MIEQGGRLDEAHDLSGLQELTSEYFLAEPGNHPWEEAKRGLFIGMKRYGNFHILHPQPSVTVEENKQRAKTTLHFLIIDRDQTIPGLDELYDNPVVWLETIDKSADLYTLSLLLRLEDGEWLVQRAKLTRFGGLQGHWQ